jgi:multimeric flavodoxin WrbA
MKILALVGSYRKSGNTSRMVDLFANQLRAEAERTGEPFEFESLNLGHAEIRPCRGCRTCFDRGADLCPLKDDIPAIKDKMQAADAWIIATPVYVGDMSGVLKNWVDRLAYICHRPEFGGKSVFLLASTGSSPATIAFYSLRALMSWGLAYQGQACFKTGALMDSDELVQRHTAACQKHARRFFKAVQRQQTVQPSFLSLMMFRIQQRGWSKADPDTLDFQYWHTQGWTDPRQTFYHPHRANPVKVSLARLVGNLMEAMMSRD